MNKKRSLISLIICTRNRCEKLKMCLSYLQKAKVPSEGIEIILVDNGSSDNTQQVICEFSKKFHSRVKYVFERKPGLARARNAGLSAASGEIILFTDDDCYVDKNFFFDALDIFKDTKIAYYGGKVLLFDPDDAKVSIKLSSDVKLIPPYSFVPADIIQGANMGFRRIVIERIGYFNELLGAGTKLCSGEDTEFIARASFHGFWGGYFPKPVVWHHHGRKELQAFSLIKGYDIGRGAYYTSMLFRRPSRLKYLKGWYWSSRKRPFPQIVREIYGGLLYCVLYFQKK